MSDVLEWLLPIHLKSAIDCYCEALKNSVPYNRHMLMADKLIINFVTHVKGTFDTLAQTDNDFVQAIFQAGRLYEQQRQLQAKKTEEA